MERKVIISADATCDIGPDMQQLYKVQLFPFRIQLGDQIYLDKEEITTEELFDAWRQKRLLPKTAAISPADYVRYFSQWVQEGCDIVHINLGSALSASFQNATLAAKELGHVYPVDSCSLSSGSGLLVAKAGELMEKGCCAQDIQQELIRAREKVSASFVLDTLEFMAAGGRCSTVTAMGANLLKLKPMIRVQPERQGAMVVGKKYRGKLENVLKEYVKNQLEGRTDLDLTRLFITSASAPADHLALVREEVGRYQSFDSIYQTTASGTIGAHCGPGTIGILFMVR